MQDCCTGVVLYANYEEYRAAVDAENELSNANTALFSSTLKSTSIVDKHVQIALDLVVAMSSEGGNGVD